MNRYQIIAACVFLAPWAGVFAATAEQTSTSSHEEYSSQTYRAPPGFGRYTWDTPLGKVDKLASEPVYVKVAHSIGKVTYFDFSCYRFLSGSENGALPSNQVLTMKACRDTDGEGFHAMAEYYVDSQGFRIGSEADGKAVLFPVTYQFCSSWSGFSSAFKGDPLDAMRLCGVRLHFRSETAAEPRDTRPSTHITPYERVLNWLVESHGEPEYQDREGEVFLPELTPEHEREKTAEKNRYSSRYWCRPQRDELKPRCSASVALVFDKNTGRGQVIYLTPDVWAYAYARQFGGAEGDSLYRLLNGGMTQPPVQYQCMETFICRPPPPPAMTEEELARFRLPTKTADAKN